MGNIEHRIQHKTLSCAADFNEAAGIYNQHPALFKHTNCLAYALGLPELGQAIPGCLATHGSPLYENQNHADYLKPLLEKDGLQEVGEEALLNPDTQIIALCIREYQGGHIYKYHQDGTWSHQKGHGGEITNLDADGKIITDLKTANLGFCDELVAYYKVPDKGIKYIPRLDIKSC